MKFLDARDGRFSQVFGNSRLLLATDKISGDSNVVMSLWYSRMSKSFEDYHAFFGFDPDERKTPRVSYGYDPMIADEIDSLQPLPAPLAAAYDLCRNAGSSQKWHLTAVGQKIFNEFQMTTKVVSGGLSLPAVLIGDAAHAIPIALSRGDINDAVYDALDLCRMIVERYDDDELFARVPDDYYDWRTRRWGDLRKEWEERWLTAHGLPYSPLHAQRYWIKLSRTVRDPPPEKMEKGDFEGLLDDKRRASFRQGQRRELMRWRKVQQRLNNREQRRIAFAVKPGVYPSKLVLRYLDSTHAPSEGGDQKRNSGTTKGHQPSLKSSRDT